MHSAHRPGPQRDRMLWWAMALLLWCVGALHAGSALAAVWEPARVDVTLSDADTPPREADWQRTQLPDIRPHHAGQPGAALPVWYRLVFDLGMVGGHDTAPHAVYLPYLYNGGDVFLGDGERLVQVPHDGAEAVVRWEHPHVWHVPRASIDADGRLVLYVKLWPPLTGRPSRMPPVVVGDRSEMEARHERRLFWARTVPQITAITSMLMAAFCLAVWSLRREETGFGWLGLALLLWGVRTLSFVVQELPPGAWLAWRVVYQGATGGFIIVMALFALRFAGLRWPRTERLMMAYGFVGPLWLLIAGLSVERRIVQYWTLGLMPIGALVFVMGARACVRLRSVQSLALAATSLLAVIAGVHDYLVSADNPVFVALFPQWAAQRAFLLHHVANLLLLTTAGMMTSRFVDSLRAYADLNRTLEARIAVREQELAASYAREAALERVKAANEERQRIVEDMHDGLGSRLVTALHRIEHGVIPQDELARLVRDCIAEMRLVMDALSPGEGGFAQALAAFRHRWQAVLQAGGIESTWEVDDAVDRLEVGSHQGLHLLLIVQEALTNVIKHARCRRVRIQILLGEGQLRCCVKDDGKGLQAAEGRACGRGLNNMRLRARRVGAELDVESGDKGTEVTLITPMERLRPPV